MAMRIKRLTKKMKISSIVMPLVWAFLASAPIYVPMFLIGDFNLVKFIASAQDPFLMFMLTLMTIIGPFIGVGFSVKAYFDRKKEYEMLYSGMHLSDVDLFKDTVSFSFFRPEYNFSCTYKDIEKVELTVSTSRHRTKNGYYYTIDNYFYAFTVLNGKQFSIEKTAPSVHKMEDIYRFIDLIKDKVGEFKYDAIGTGRTEDVEEKIKWYLHNSYSKNYAKNELEEAKIGSIVVFFIGAVVTFIFKDVLILALQDIRLLGLFLSSIPLLIFGASIVMDWQIHKDMLNDPQADKKKYNILWLKPWQMIAVKILLIFEFVHIILS